MVMTGGVSRPCTQALATVSIRTGQAKAGDKAPVAAETDRNCAE